MDETLSWGTHISEVSGKVAKVLASIYKSLSLPHLDFCSVVWGNIEQSGTYNNWNRLGCQITPDPLRLLHDEPRRQENKPIKNITVQNTEQASTRIYIR